MDEKQSVATMSIAEITEKATQLQAIVRYVKGATYLDKSIILQIANATEDSKEDEE